MNKYGNVSDIAKTFASISAKEKTTFTREEEVYQNLGREGNIHSIVFSMALTYNSSQIVVHFDTGRRMATVITELPAQPADLNFSIRTCSMLERWFRGKWLKISSKNVAISQFLEKNLLLRNLALLCKSEIFSPFIRAYSINQPDPKVIDEIVDNMAGNETSVFRIETNYEIRGKQDRILQGIIDFQKSLIDHLAEPNMV
jgi:hypothetical protein